MNRRQFLITSIVAGVAVVAAPALKHLPVPIYDEIFDMAQAIQRMLERQLYKPDVWIVNPTTYAGIRELINAD